MRRSEVTRHDHVMQRTRFFQLGTSPPRATCRESPAPGNHRLVGSFMSTITSIMIGEAVHIGPKT